MIFLTYFGLRQTNIFSKINITFDEKPILKSKILNTEKPDTFQLIFQRIEQLMHKEKLYLEPDLSIDKIASRLNVNSTYLSRAINQKGDQTFFN